VRWHRRIDCRARATAPQWSRRRAGEPQIASRRRTLLEPIRLLVEAGEALDQGAYAGPELTAGELEVVLAVSAVGLTAPPPRHGDQLPSTAIARQNRGTRRARQGQGALDPA
jgi:hypothetical protein